MKQDFIENNIIIISKQTLDIFLEQKNPRDLIALYCFYYYTAKWQKTNQPKASISYCARGLKCGTDKIRKIKQELIKLGLIEDFRHIDEKTKKVKGWYVRIKYIWKKESHPVNFQEGGNQKTTLSKSHTVAKTDPNALSVNSLNALSANNIEQSSKEEFSFLKELELLKKGGKTGKRKDFQIIALYWKKKNWQFENREQFNSAFKRELRPAKSLKGYSGTQIAKAIKHCDEKYNEWSLETLHKRISDLVNKK